MKTTYAQNQFMENSEKTLSENKSRKDLNRPALAGTKTIILIGAIVMVLGILASFFFSKTIEKFFWEVRARSTIEAVDKFSKSLQGADIAGWNDSVSREHLGIFANDIKQSLPNISAIKIFTIDGAIAWTDLQHVSPGYREPGIEDELNEVKGVEHMIMSAGELTKNELGKADLLEVWTTVRGPQGETLGFIEFYFDTSDITTFINQIQYSFLGSIFTAVAIILFLLRLTFRQQNDIIVRQAHSFSEVVEKSPVGIYTINQDGVITSMNSKMMMLLSKKDHEEIVGQSVFNIKEIQKLKIEGLIRELLIGKPLDKEIIFIGEKGDETYQHHQGVPIFKDDGKTVEQVLFMVSDITERKRLEKELRLRTENLEAHVTERTKELQSKIDELERFERLTVGREIRMTELKQQIEKMRAKCESLGVDVSAL